MLSLGLPLFIITHVEYSEANSIIRISAVFLIFSEFSSVSAHFRIVCCFYVNIMSKMSSFIPYFRHPKQAMYIHV